MDFIAELTMHFPPKGVHMIRYYGLYSSRTKGKLNQEKKENGIDITEGNDDIDINDNISSKESRKAWARLIHKVYEVDPMICKKCGSEVCDNCGRVKVKIKNEEVIARCVICS